MVFYKYRPIVKGKIDTESVKNFVTLLEDGEIIEIFSLIFFVDVFRNIEDIKFDKNFVLLDNNALKLLLNILKVKNKNNELLFSFFVYNKENNFSNFLYPPDSDTNSIIGRYLVNCMKENKIGNFNEVKLIWKFLNEIINTFEKKFFKLDDNPIPVWLDKKNGNEEKSKDYGTMLNVFGFLSVLGDFLNSGKIKDEKNKNVKEIFFLVKEYIFKIMLLGENKKKFYYRYYVSPYIIRFLEIYNFYLGMKFNLDLNKEKEIIFYFKNKQVKLYNDISKIDLFFLLLIEIYYSKIGLQNYFIQKLNVKNFIIKEEFNFFKLGSKEIYFSYPQLIVDFLKMINGRDM